VPALKLGVVALLATASMNAKSGTDAGETLSSDDAKGREALPDGVWGRVGPPPDSLDERIAALEAIGYVQGSLEAPGFEGVTLHDAAAVSQGLNFVVSGHKPEAILMDMDGKTLHAWSLSFEEAFPGRVLSSPNVPGRHYWRRAYLEENGDVLAIFEGLGLVRIDKQSKLLWAYSERAHHDLDLRPDGDIYTLIRVPRLVVEVNPSAPILEDYVARLSGDGVEQRRWSVLEAVERSEFAHIWDKSEVNEGDIFHTNSIRILGERAEAANPAFAPGRVLTSMRSLDAVAVIDLESNRLVWAQKGPFRSQHDPRILDDGHLLVFDNRGLKKKSRVLEFDLSDMTRTWEYVGSDDDPFFTMTCGTASRLLNGNTLIADTNHGRAFEVTRQGEVVWNYYNPHRAGKRKQFIAKLFEIQRVPRDFVAGWLHP